MPSRCTPRVMLTHENICSRRCKGRRIFKFREELMSVRHPKRSCLFVAGSSFCMLRSALSSPACTVFSCNRSRVLQRSIIQESFFVRGARGQFLVLPKAQQSAVGCIKFLPRNHSTFIRNPVRSRHSFPLKCTIMQRSNILFLAGIILKFKKKNHSPIPAVIPC